MSKVKVWEKKSFWLILLGILCVVIVGLGAGVIILSNKNKPTMEIDFILPEELQKDDLSPEDEVIKETTLMMQDPDKKEEDIESYYDMVIEKAIDDGDINLAMKIIIQKTNFLVVVENDCGNAKSYIDSLDFSIYQDNEINYLQSYIDSIMGYCDDLDNKSTKDF